MPTIDEVIRNRKMLDMNYNDLLSAIPSANKPASSLREGIFSMPTTHTFGYEKVLIDSFLSRAVSVFPYKDILFKDKALLSDRLRSKKNGSSQPSLMRKMSKAREYGLDEYVFAYLGLHEYYYAKNAGMEMPAFGVFIHPSTDAFYEDINATLWDLESRFASLYKPENITLDVSHARDYTAFEIANIYGEFFNYWICQDYAEKEYHDDNMWEYKREFHYKERVDLSDISMIIWPIEMINNDSDVYEPRNGVQKEIEEFERRNEDIMVYKYQWTFNEGLRRFSYASYIVSLYAFENKGECISKDEFEDQFTSRFPNLN